MPRCKIMMKMLLARREMHDESLTSPLNIVTPVTLEGSVVRLEPLRREHAELFWKHRQERSGRYFRWIPYP